MGAATINLTPALAQEKIREGARQALLNRSSCHLDAPSPLTMEINYKDHFYALRASYYPGVTMLDDFTVSYTADSVEDVMRARMFIL